MRRNALRVVLGLAEQPRDETGFAGAVGAQQVKHVADTEAEGNWVARNARDVELELIRHTLDDS